MSVPTMIYVTFILLIIPPFIHNCQKNMNTPRVNIDMSVLRVFITYRLLSHNRKQKDQSQQRPVFPSCFTD